MEPIVGFPRHLYVGKTTLMTIPHIKMTVAHSLTLVLREGACERHKEILEPNGTLERFLGTEHDIAIQRLPGPFQIYPRCWPLGIKPTG